MFSQRKIAQTAAFLLDRGTGRMSYLKLMKLLYLADRESLRRHGEPISGDRYVSMDQGPVLSQTLDLINGAVEFEERGWNHWIADKANYEVSLRRKVSREVLDELSEAEIEVLDAVYDKFGKWDKWRLRDYTHRHCSEWKDPHGSSIPIEVVDIFKAVGRSPAEARKLAARIEHERRIDRLFAAL